MEIFAELHVHFVEIQDTINMTVLAVQFFSVYKHMIASTFQIFISKESHISNVIDVQIK